MKYCQICGFPAPNDAKYCEKCGKSLIGKSDMPNEPFFIPSIGGGNNRNIQTSYQKDDNGTSLPSFLMGKGNPTRTEDGDIGFDFDTPNEEGKNVKPVKPVKPKKEVNKKLRRYIFGFIFLIVAILAFVFIKEGISSHRISLKNAEKILYETANDIEYCEDILGKADEITNGEDNYTYKWNSWLSDDEIVIIFRQSELDGEYIVKNIYFNGKEVTFKTE